MKYNEEVIQNGEKTLRGLLDELPSYCKTFSIGKASTTSIRTRIAYMRDIKTYLTYVQTECKRCQGKELIDITLEDLESISGEEIEFYLNSYLKMYETDTGVHTNGERAMHRKISALKSFYKYFIRKNQIKINPTDMVDSPKIKDKNIIKLEPNEVVEFLNGIEEGTSLTERQKKFHEHTKIRDIAIFTTLLGTGIRVSELVGLNLEDLNFDDGYMIILRKGGKEDEVFFGPEVEEALIYYIDCSRELFHPSEEENALFLSLRGKRISVRTIEEMTKKYATATLPAKGERITPHKMRSTFGTNLYNETEDIYLVASILGHKDINTTQRHYANQGEYRKRAAASKIKLREEI